MCTCDLLSFCQHLAQSQKLASSRGSGQNYELEPRYCIWPSLWPRAVHKEFNLWELHHLLVLGWPKGLFRFFSIQCHGKNPNKLFGQPNIMERPFPACHFLISCHFCPTCQTLFSNHLFVDYVLSPAKCKREMIFFFLTLKNWSGGPRELICWRGDHQAPEQAVCCA